MNQDLDGDGARVASMPFSNGRESPSVLSISLGQVPSGVPRRTPHFLDPSVQEHIQAVHSGWILGPSGL